jgi:hypothetical protein
MTITLDEILVALTPEEEEEALRRGPKPPSVTKPIAPVQDTETIPELASMNTDPMRPPPVAAQRARPRSAAEEVLAMRGGAVPPSSGPGRAGEVLAARRAAAERPSAADEYAAAVRRQRMDEGAQGMITGLTRAITAGRATPNLAPVTQIEDYMRGRALKQEEAGQQQAAQDRATAAARADRDESREERALRLREEGATRDAEADRLRLETARGDHEFQQSLRDPNSPTSQNYKQNFIDTLRILASGEGSREELPGINIDDVLARVENMSAYEISTDPSLESLRNHAARMTQTQAGQRTRARGSGVGGASMTVRLERDPETGAYTAPLDPIRAQLLAFENSRGVADAAQNESYVRALSDDDVLKRLNSAGSGGASGERTADQRVRDLSRDMQESQAWESTVNTTNRMLRGASDAELSAALGLQAVPVGVPPERIEQIQAAIATFRNQLLRERSGAAVTANELERLRQELGGGEFSSPAVLRGAVQRAVAGAGRLRALMRAGYGADVVDAFDSNLQREGGGGRRRPVLVDGVEQNLTRDEARALQQQGRRVERPRGGR